MSDEQMIYISPEDDLTTVRERLERLENVPTHRVTLVVPTHTQLRSHVAWKLLYARARDLGKEVLIVSSDPQIRSVAHAAKFRVAHSLESSPVGRTRPTTRPGRSNSGTKSGRTLSPRTQPPPASGEARGAGNVRTNQPGQGRSWFSAASEQPSVLPERNTQRSRADDDTTASNLSHSGHLASSTFGSPPRSFGQSYDFRVDTNPPIRPLSQEVLDEDPDLLLEDFHQAQDIRQAALKGNASEGAEDEETEEKVSLEPDKADATRSAPLAPSPASIFDDPFTSMEDALPPPIMEQRGFASLQGSSTHEHVIQDVADLPTELFDDRIEYEGRVSDLGQGFPDAHSWAEPTPEDEQDIVGPSRPQSVRPHSSSRTGRPDRTPPLPPPLDFTDDALPPPSTQPSVSQRPPVPQRIPSGPVKRPSAPLALPSSGQRTSPQGSTTQGRSTQGKTTQGRSTLPRPQQAPARRPGTTAALQGKQAKPPLSRRVGPGVIAVVFLFLILLGILAYAGPSTDVTLTIQSRAYTHAISLTARAGGQKSVDSVPATLQTQVFTLKGTGSATGNGKVGTAPAMGSVTFTNNSTTHIITVPTHTIITTSDGTRFETEAEISLNIAGAKVGSTVPVPIQALAPGEGGNVAAGTITVIPPDSLNTLAQVNDNIATSELKISVTNEKPTSGGGAANATVVVANDLDAAKSALQKQLQPDVDKWLQQLSKAGIVGTPSIAANLVNAPKEQQPVDGGTFPVTLNETVSVLLVYTIDLQHATIDYLNNAMQKDHNYQGDVVLSDANHPVIWSHMKSSGNATSMTLNFTANALAIPNMQVEQIQQIVRGKSITEATAALKKGLPGVQQAEVKSSLIFTPIPWVAYWRINVNLITRAAH